MTEIKQLTTMEAKRLIDGINFADVEEKAMDFCLLMSTFIWAGFIEGKLACIWGVIPPSLMSDKAYLWLYTTDVIKEHQFLLVRHSQLVIKDILEQFPVIVGHATIGASKSIRWLKWLGAEFGSPQGTQVGFIIKRSD